MPYVQVQRVRSYRPSYTTHNPQSASLSHSDSSSSIDSLAPISTSRERTVTRSSSSSSLTLVAPIEAPTEPATAYDPPSASSNESPLDPTAAEPTIVYNTRSAPLSQPAAAPIATHIEQSSTTYEAPSALLEESSSTETAAEPTSVYNTRSVSLNDAPTATSSNQTTQNFHASPLPFQRTDPAITKKHRNAMAYRAPPSLFQRSTDAQNFYKGPHKNMKGRNLPEITYATERASSWSHRRSISITDFSSRAPSPINPETSPGRQLTTSQHYAPPPIIEPSEQEVSNNNHRTNVYSLPRLDPHYSTPIVAKSQLTASASARDLSQPTPKQSRFPQLSRATHASISNSANSVNGSSHFSKSSLHTTKTAGDLGRLSCISPRQSPSPTERVQRDLTAARPHMHTSKSIYGVHRLSSIAQERTPGPTNSVKRHFAVVKTNVHTSKFVENFDPLSPVLQQRTPSPGDFSHTRLDIGRSNLRASKTLEDLTIPSLSNESYEGISLGRSNMQASKTLNDLTIPNAIDEARTIIGLGRCNMQASKTAEDLGRGSPKLVRRLKFPSMGRLAFSKIPNPVFDMMALPQPRRHVSTPVLPSYKKENIAPKTLRLLGPISPSRNQPPPIVFPKSKTMSTLSNPFSKSTQDLKNSSKSLASLRADVAEPVVTKSSPPLPLFTTNSRQIHGAQPNSYWSGRYQSLSDRYRTDMMHRTMDDPHAYRQLVSCNASLSPSSSVKFQDKLRSICKSIVPRESRMDDSEGGTPALLITSSNNLSEDNTRRCQQVFYHLQVLCYDDEAKNSLWEFQLQYARKERNEQLLPAGGLMSDKKGWVTKIGKTFNNIGKSDLTSSVMERQSKSGLSAFGRSKRSDERD